MLAADPDPLSEFSSTSISFASFIISRLSTSRPAEYWLLIGSALRLQPPNPIPESAFAALVQSINQLLTTIASQIASRYAAVNAITNQVEAITTVVEAVGCYCSAVDSIPRRLRSDRQPNEPVRIGPKRLYQTPQVRPFHFWLQSLFKSRPHSIRRRVP